MRAKYELRCECPGDHEASHPWYCYQRVKPNYVEARNGANQLLAFIYSGAILSNKRYHEIVDEAVKRIVDAAWDEAKATTQGSEQR